ncbi:MAG: PQQ-dependent catabolism-associated CXXCW motif protein, partial [Pseudorhodobacter sp.]|nr:PQQ-dependent catabolism-associated CXXCW motif protein [Pseudorhodobacter sp.]
GGDPERPVVFFCLSDCWMSWNAATRALNYGYTRVFWYPLGTDGWAAQGYPTEALEPEPGGQ